MLTYMDTKIPRKARGFIIDKTSGHPLAGIVVEAVAQWKMSRDINVSLGLLVSDGAGYLSFDLRALEDLKLPVDHLFLCPIGDDSAKIDLVTIMPNDSTESRNSLLANAETDNQSRLYFARFILKADSKLVSRGNERSLLPSIQNPDLEDWEVSPYSFSIKKDIVLGEAGCEVLAQSTEVEREYRFSQVVRRARAQKPRMPYEQSLGNLATKDYPHEVMKPLLDPTAAIDLSTSMEIFYGEVLEFKQTWNPKGHALGSIQYSTSLAPCESVNIAVIDWSRKDDIIREDAIVSKESLYHSQRRDRIIDEAVRAAIQEDQGGWSLLTGSAGAGSAGTSGTGSASATVPIYGIPVDLSGTGTGSAALSALHSIGAGISQSWGNRDLTGKSVQKLHDSILQATNITRSLNSTVVVQATQAERNYLETRTITNHNHCHALTIQYYEVLRHFMVVTEYIGSRQVVLLPYKLIEFNFENALRYRAILEPVLLDRTLASCFDAITRLHITPEIYSLKKYQESADTSNGVGSTNTTSTQPKPKINRYELTLESNPKHNWGSTWGGIGIHLRLKTGANVPLWFKTSVADRGQELNKIAFPIEITDPEVINLGTDPANIDMVKVAWSEDNGNDSWAFAGIRIRYALEGQVGFVGTIIDEHGDPENPELKRFDNGENLLWTKDVSIASPTPSPTSDPQLPTKTSLEKSPLIVLSKIEDAICEKKLIAHLNNNKVYYSRAIWLLQDPSERVMMLNHMLPGLINDIDTTPIAVSGNYLAFPYNAEPTKEEEDRERERLKKYPPSKSITSIPTRGLFAETQLSHCNACEVRDVTRFWQWDESPCEKPPTIEGITPGPRGQPPNVETTTLPSPVVQIMQPPAAPDPVGLAAALSLLGQPNIFRDMSGMKELQELLSGLSSGSVDLAKAQLLANEAQQKLGSQMHTSLFGGKGLGQSPEQRYDNLQVAKEVAKAAPEMGWDEQTKSDVTSDIVRGGRESIGTPPNIQFVSSNITHALEWEDLLRFRVPQAIQSDLKNRNMSVQPFGGATGAWINLDLFPVIIEKFPTLNGVKLDAKSLIREIRLGMVGKSPLFVDPDYSIFLPYDSTDETKWKSNDPTGTVVFIDIPGPDDAAVVASRATDQYWIFSTVTTPRSGQHPVTGHRLFGIQETAKGDFVIFTKGADLSSGFAESQFGIRQLLTFPGGEKLWRSFQQRIVAWVKAHGGVAVTQDPDSQRYQWSLVRALLGRQNNEL